MKYQITARRVTGEDDIAVFDEPPEESVEGGHTTYSGVTSGHPATMVIAPGYYAMVKVFPVEKPVDTSEEESPEISEEPEVTTATTTQTTQSTQAEKAEKPLQDKERRSA